MGLLALAIGEFPGEIVVFIWRLLMGEEALSSSSLAF
jgi:hypothetical protein